MIFEKIRERLQDVIDGIEVYTVGRLNTEKANISILQLQRFANELKKINQVEAEYNNGWIRVDDRLPEPYKKVLVLEENGEIHLCRYHNESTRFYYDGSDWDIKLGCVTHWRELPQPPKGE